MKSLSSILYKLLSRRGPSHSKEMLSDIAKQIEAVIVGSGRKHIGGYQLVIPRNASSYRIVPNDFHHFDIESIVIPLRDLPSVSKVSSNAEDSTSPSSLSEDSKLLAREALEIFIYLNNTTTAS